MGYRLAGEDASAFHVHDGKGIFRVAKGALGQDMHAKIRAMPRMDEGGEVEKPAESKEPPEAKSTGLVEKIKSWMAAPKQPATNENERKELNQLDSSGYADGGEVSPPPLVQGDFTPQPGQDVPPSAGPTANPYEANQLGPGGVPIPGTTPAPWNLPNPDDTEFGPGGEILKMADQAKPEEAVPAPTPAIAPPPTPQQALPNMAMPNPYGGIQGELKGIEKQGLKGIQEQGEAQAATSKAQADALRSGLDLQQKHQEAFQQNLQAINNEHDNIVQDIMNHQINPQQFWQNKGVADKAASLIGIILGGAAAGLNGGHNPALEVLQKQVDNDIEAQRANMQNRQTLLGDNTRKYGNAMQAESMTRLQMAASLEGQLKLGALQSGDKAAQAQVDQLTANFRNGLLPQKMQMAQFGAMQQMMKQGGGARLALDEDSAKKAREGLMENGVIAGKVQALQQFAAQHPQGTWSPSDAQHAHDLMADLTESWNKPQEGLNRLTDTEVGMLHEMIKDPSSVYNAITGKSKVSIKDLATAVANKRKAVENAYLVPGVNMHPGMSMFMPEYGKRMVIPPGRPLPTVTPLAPQ